jgi:hypothetical protein
VTNANISQLTFKQRNVIISFYTPQHAHEFKRMLHGWRSPTGYRPQLHEQDVGEFTMALTHSEFHAVMQYFMENADA